MFGPQAPAWLIYRLKTSFLSLLIAYYFIFFGFTQWKFCSCREDKWVRLNSGRCKILPLKLSCACKLCSGRADGRETINSSVYQASHFYIPSVLLFSNIHISVRHQNRKFFYSYMATCMCCRCQNEMLDSPVVGWMKKQGNTALLDNPKESL